MLEELERVVVPPPSETWIIPRSELVALPVNVEVPVEILAKIILLEADLVTTVPVLTSKLPLRVMSPAGSVYVGVPLAGVNDKLL